MAAKKQIAVKKTGTSIANIDAELSNEIGDLKRQIGQASGSKLSLAASGDFELPDGSNLGNEIQIVVIDFISRNNFYDQKYNRDNPAPPACYAMGKEIATMAPEPDSPDIQNEDCATCPMNQFGSGDNGRSKACQNRRLAVVQVIDPDNPEAHLAPDSPLYTFDMSPSNIKAFDGAMNMATRSMGHYIKVIMTATGKNVGTYATVSFSDMVPNPDYATQYARRAECEPLLTRKPDFAAAAAKAPPARGRAAPARKTAAPRR